MIKIKNINKYFSNILITGLGLMVFNVNSQTHAIPQEERDKYLTIEKHLSEKKRTGKLFSGNEAVIVIEKKNIEKTPYYNSTQLRTMDEFLEKESYSKFFEYFSTISVNEKAPIKYFITKQNDGHIPLFWLMSNTYSLDSDAFNTHKWLYVSLIMTTQDSNLCSDPTALTAPKTLLREFPSILNIITRTPQHIQPAIEDATRFIRSLKNRTHPNWVCSYGSQTIAPDKSVTYDPKTWNMTRENVLLRFLKPYNLK